MKKFMCVMCGFIYDEEIGDIESGIIPGTKWANIPDSWACPDCGMRKNDFEMVEL